MRTSRSQVSLPVSNLPLQPISSVNREKHRQMPERHLHTNTTSVIKLLSHMCFVLSQHTLTHTHIAGQNDHEVSKSVWGFQLQCHTEMYLCQTRVEVMKDVTSERKSSAVHTSTRHWPMSTPTCRALKSFSPKHECWGSCLQRFYDSTQFYTL